LHAVASFKPSSDIQPTKLPQSLLSLICQMWLPTTKELEKYSSSVAASQSNPGQNTYSSIPYTQSSPPQKGGRFCCKYKSCVDPKTGTTPSFRRTTDLNRHIKSQHKPTYEDCPWPKCERKGKNGFTRNDHLMTHRRDYHKENIPKRRKLNSSESAANNNALDCDSSLSPPSAVEERKLDTVIQIPVTAFKRDDPQTLEDLIGSVQVDPYPECEARPGLLVNIPSIHVALQQSSKRCMVCRERKIKVAPLASHPSTGTNNRFLTVRQGPSRVRKLLEERGNLRGLYPYSTVFGLPDSRGLPVSVSPFYFM
jgi:hypothetical protein